ncbi:integrase catalytic domain-containing protein [Trichonephila clavipes]|uniref:Integrase catalytic domain-containing protein n=1 Tax=Trichonephila clavipes TaxID=2585209 RepID=A0A8X6W667_TRICX|nr:integrase catalytic domain-containing protein [Trichonephila clavipes]
MCISDLWKHDSLGITDPVETKTKLEIQKETLNYFQKTISVDISGRYEVALPWVLNNKLLSSNRKLAENRLESTKRKLIATGKFEEYQEVLDFWLSGKIIEEVNDDKENFFVHYLPHRPVIKENSTSKIRPVFDASARTKGSPSLNDCLEKGPNFIEVIPTILNRFRKYKIGVISDIEKAFLQIGFLSDIQSFLLGATLNHHLDNAHGNFDNVAKILRKSFYVDNCVTSFETEEQLQKFIDESKILLSSAHFNLRGWQSNVLLNPENFSELESQPDNFETMVLGLIWNLKDDCLSCNINCQKNEGKAITKRSLLSIANHIFDPIGFTAPVTLKPKLILQEIWKLKLKWDENLPKDILNQVKKWVKEIRNLSDVSSWERVPSEKNFADILSRGCSAQQLVYLRWWEGPSWLSESPVQCPRSKQVPDEEAVNLELRKSVLVNTAKRIEEFNWHSKYFSSYLKVVRMIAWIFRFFKNAKRIDVCNTSEITFSEFDHAEKTVIKLIEMEKFEGVTDEKLRPLKPFLDEFGILRARTKLSFREDTDNFKFPIILPNEHPVVHLMIVRKHEELMHAGVDLAGPLHLKDRRKGWVVLFTCAVFHAVHFELITSLSTAAFLQSLRRFISRRGRPTIIYSDNGTNFVGSNSALNSNDWDVVMSKANIQKNKVEI